VDEGFAHTDVGVLQFYIFANQGNADALTGLLQAFDGFAPLAQVGVVDTVLQAKVLDDQVGQTGLFEHEWHIVDGVGGDDRDDRTRLYVAEERDFGADFIIDRVVGTQAHAVLGGFGFQFAAGAHVGQQGDMCRQSRR